MAAKSIGIDHRGRVWVGTALEQPARDLYLVVVDAHVEQRRASERRSVKRERLVGVAAELRWEDLPMRECTRQQSRVTTQMLLEQIDSSTVHCHRRRVGKLDPMLRRQLQAQVLSRRVARVRLKHHRNGSESITLLI